MEAVPTYKILLLIGFVFIMLTFLSTSILWIRLYRNRFSHKVNVLGSRSETSTIVYSSFILIPLVSILFLVMENLISGVCVLVVMLIFAVFFMKMPLSAIKEAHENVRLPWIVYKNKYLNLLTPLSTLLIGLIAIIIASGLR